MVWVWRWTVGKGRIKVNQGWQKVEQLIIVNQWGVWRRLIVPNDNARGSFTLFAAPQGQPHPS
jgi:hypothetical protein